MLWINAEFGAGRIETAIREAKEFSNRNNVGVILKFNDIELQVSPISDEEDLLEFFNKVCELKSNDLLKEAAK